jgi:hypothetical protein
LVYIGATGLLAPRYDDSGTVDFMGNETLDILGVLNHEAIAEGRKRSARRLAAGVARFLTYGDTPPVRRDLMHAVEDDSYGLVRWFCAKEGAREEPFKSFALDRSPLWRKFCGTA